VAILAKGMDPLESRRGLPGDEGDTHSRYTVPRLEVAASYQTVVLRISESHR
jgi:hypothetical protein